MQRVPASALVFLSGEALPSRESLHSAVQDLDPEPIFRDEGERGPDLVVRVAEGQRVAVNLEAGPAPAEVYDDHLRSSGLEAADQERVRSHRCHARCSFLDSGDDEVDLADRMSAVYRVAARLSGLAGLGVLAPTSGVFALGLAPEHVDGRLDDGVPPLDLWVQVEMKDEDTARSVGGPSVGVHEVELRGVRGLDPDLVYSSVLGALAYLERIRRELVPGETLHIGSQPFVWGAVKAPEGLVVLERKETEPPS